MLLFSIIIPVYNGERYLPDALDSVLVQKTSDYEVILIDDGSTDETANICDSYASNYDFVRTIHIENQGTSHARNRGLSYAKGEYVLFLDADDLWKPELLSVVGELTNERPDMILFGSEKFDEGLSIEERSSCYIPSGESGKAWFLKILKEGVIPPPYMWSYAYRREFLLKHDLYVKEDLVCSEDFDYNMRVIPLAKRVYGTQQILYRWRQVSTSLSHTLTAEKLMDNLTTKAQVFEQFPCGALANLYMDNAVLLGRIPRAQAQICVDFLKNHRYIEKSCTQLPLKLAAGFFHYLDITMELGYMKFFAKLNRRFSVDSSAKFFIYL